MPSCNSQYFVGLSRNRGITILQSPGLPRTRALAKFMVRFQAGLAGMRGSLGSTLTFTINGFPLAIDFSSLDECIRA